MASIKTPCDFEGCCNGVDRKGELCPNCQWKLTVFVRKIKYAKKHGYLKTADLKDLFVCEKS